MMKLPPAFAAFAAFAATLLFQAADAALVLEDVNPHLVVEPFVAAWCADQFSDLLDVSGYDMAAMARHGQHVKLEPFLGEWCFDQFPQRLPPDNQDRRTARLKLYSSHKQIEPYFEQWGRDSTSEASSPPTLISLEPYIGHWCSVQYPTALADLSGDTDEFFVSVKENHQKLEPALARWCFAQFPEELGSVDDTATVDSLKTDHKVVENELIKWFLANDAANEAATEAASIAANDAAIAATVFAPDPGRGSGPSEEHGNNPSSSGALLAWAVIATCALAVNVSVQLYCCACKRRRTTAKTETTTPEGTDIPEYLC